MKLHFTKFGIAILFDSRSRLDLFKSPSEKKIRVNDNMSVRVQQRPKLGSSDCLASLTNPLWTSLRTRIDILSLTHRFFSDGGLNKSISR